MSESTGSQAPGEKPEPRVEQPDPGPGGPADQVEDELTENPVTPDQPRSAQVEEEQVPDEIDQPEDLDEGEKDVEPGDEAPA